MSKIVLNDLFLVQQELDETIAKNHNITYANTRERRILSLLVEVGELANTTRCFKYWSYKPSEEKSVVLDEYADGLHFLLSLGVDLSTSKKEYELTENLGNLTSQFHLVYSKIESFKKEQNDATYIDAFQTYLNLIPLLDSSWEEVKEAYYKKLGENHHRQNTNY
jgi:dimeric dUTPase (all-alpha-NTP-PPase superfamily)